MAEMQKYEMEESLMGKVWSAGSHNTDPALFTMWPDWER